MKTFSILLGISMILCYSSCKKSSGDDVTIAGDQSPMGTVGTTVGSSSAEIAGVSSFNATVTALNDGVSTYSGSAIITNAAIKNVLANIPEITIKGDTVSTTNMKFRNTLEGIEILSGPGQGILVKYGSEVGDTYPIGSTGNVRTVVSKSTTDDYGYGFYLIKVVQVEETPTYLKSLGVSKITYWGNHKFGLVGFDMTMSDGSSAKFPVYTSTGN